MFEGNKIFSFIAAVSFRLLHLLGLVSFVRLDPGREDDHSGGWQSDHHWVGGPAGDRPLYEPAAQSGKQQSHPGYHDHTGGFAEPQAGQC